MPTMSDDPNASPYNAFNAFMDESSPGNYNLGNFFSMSDNYGTQYDPNQNNSRTTGSQDYYNRSGEDNNSNVITTTAGGYPDYYDPTTAVTADPGYADYYDPNKSTMTWEDLRAGNADLFSTLQQSQISALANAYGDGTGGIDPVLAMLSDPGWQSLGDTSTTTRFKTVGDTGAAAYGEYTGPNDVYGWEDGVKMGTLQRIDYSNNWAYLDSSGNFVGQTPKYSTATDRMTSAGVDDVSAGVTDVYNYYQDQGNQNPGVDYNADVAPVDDSEYAAPVIGDDEAIRYVPPDMPGMLQVPDQRDTLWKMLTGQITTPYLDKILAGNALRQEEEMNYARSGLATRGVQNSTSGMAELANLGTTHDSANAMAALQALGIVAPSMGQAIDQTFNQNMDVNRTGFDQFERSNRLQSDMDEREDLQRNRALEMMLKAIQGQQPYASVPGYQAPAGGSSALENLFTIIGNM